MPIRHFARRGDLKRLFDADQTITSDWTFTGDVTLGSTSELRLENSNDASLSSTDHAFQIGPTSGGNLIMDGNEILSRDNGAAGLLTLQADGGTVRFGGSTALTEFEVNATDLDFNGDVDISGTLNVSGRTDVDVIGVADEIRVGDGSAVDPSINFSSDGNSGIFWGGESVTAIASNGSDVASFGASRFQTRRPLFIFEQAAATANLAGYGQLWVKNTTPCQLWFTDDAGNDTRIV